MVLWAWRVTRKERNRQILRRDLLKIDIGIKGRFRVARYGLARLLLWSPAVRKPPLPSVGKKVVVPVWWHEDVALI